MSIGTVPLATDRGRNLSHMLTNSLHLPSVSFSSAFCVLLVVGGCSTKPQVDPVTKLTTEVKAIGEQLARVETRLQQLDESVGKARNEINDLKAEQAKATTNQDAAKVNEELLTKRLASLESIHQELRTEFGQLRSQVRQTPSPASSAANVKPKVDERSKEKLLDAVEKGYAKAMIAGLGTEDKLRALAQYQYFRRNVEEGKDPRVTVSSLSLMSSDDVYIIRTFFPLFLPGS